MARVYVASSWRNEFQPAVVDALIKAGHAVYDFRNPHNGVPGFKWSEIDPEWQSWRASDYRELLTTHPIASRGFVSDLRGMQWADTCVLVLPCGRSAHLEAGWFTGQGKRCIILTQDGEEPELMALLANNICISLQEVLDILADTARPATPALVPIGGGNLVDPMQVSLLEWDRSFYANGSESALVITLADGTRRRIKHEPQWGSDAFQVERAIVAARAG